MVGIFTSDDVGTGGSERCLEAFWTVTAWLDSHGLRCTYFWVPKAGDRPRDRDETWLPAIRAAENRGHDFQLHGLTHSSCLEFGLPQASTRRANPRPFEEYEANREWYEVEHSVARLTAKLREATAIYERAFNRRPMVFRAPCFGIGPTAYAALHAVGIRHSSSRGLNPTATAYTTTHDPALRRWAPDYPCRPWVEPPGVTEYVCFEDLSIAGVPAEELEDRLDLYRSELSSFLSEAGDDGVLVLGTHFRSMHRTWDTTRRLFDRLLPWLADRGVTTWRTFVEYLDQPAPG